MSSATFGLISFVVTFLTISLGNYFFDNVIDGLTVTYAAGLLTVFLTLAKAIGNSKFED